MNKVIGVAITLILTFIAMAYTMTLVGFVTGNIVAAGIVSVFVGGFVAIVVSMLGNKRTGLKF